SAKAGPPEGVTCPVRRASAWQWKRWRNHPHHPQKFPTPPKMPAASVPTAFDLIRHYGSSSVAVSGYLLQIMARLARHLRREAETQRFISKSAPSKNTTQRRYPF
ncbi:MAG: DUF2254 domain-containing protein, partial [Armatimonadetes bacterium]|nr:DUF2254 domain-containing protein [Armatimonadota bacterium]